MNLSITLSADDIDAAATGLGLCVALGQRGDLLWLADALGRAAASQPGSPRAQTLLRLLAESIRADIPDPADIDGGTE